jgi:hypothetical protein
VWRSGWGVGKDSFSLFVHFRTSISAGKWTKIWHPGVLRHALAQSSREWLAHLKEEEGGGRYSREVMGEEGAAVWHANSDHVAILSLSPPAHHRSFTPRVREGMCLMRCSCRGRGGMPLTCPCRSCPSRSFLSLSPPRRSCFRPYCEGVCDNACARWARKVRRHMRRGAILTFPCRSCPSRSFLSSSPPRRSCFRPAAAAACRTREACRK